MSSDTAKAVPLTCHGHSRPVTHLSFSPVGDDEQYYLISGCKDGNPMLRDGITGDWIGTFLGHKGAVWQARLSTDASLAATASADFSAKVWDTHAGECLHTLQHGHIVRAAAFPSQPNPQLLATGGHEKKLRIFDLSRSSSSGNSSASSSPTSPDRMNGTPLIAPCYEIGPGVYDNVIKSIVWGPDTNILITASDDKKIRWWDIRSRTVAAVHDLDGPIGSCELDNLSAPSLAVAAGKSAYFFSGTVPGQLLKTVQTSHEIASVALHAEAGKFVTGGSEDPWVRVYDFETERELDVHKGHHGPIWSVSFAPDGKLYATGSEDGTVKLWKFCTEPYGLWRSL